MNGPSGRDHQSGKSSPAVAFVLGGATHVRTGKGDNVGAFLEKMAIG